ncbi:glycosyltransferase [Pannus brasiliensis CCIBt3594]|uniref:Glycosyltransferase n=1 Tax=Pannus brasiliensis CCIBt3594 TaxID=1427578 RepID=A0AAW9QPF4_9CHRO
MSQSTPPRKSGPKTSLERWLRSSAPALVRVKQRLSARRWPERSIVIYMEKYRPKLPTEVWQYGASGTQAAVTFLSREWTKRGYEVTIFGNCEGMEGEEDGIRYVNYYRMNWEDHFETLVISRHPTYRRPHTRAERVFFDWQDIKVPASSYTPEILGGYSKIFCKSQYQRDLLDFMPDRQCAIVPNGIDSSLLNVSETVPESERLPYRLVYASRYYRGLESMLRDGWPIIKREIPEAELHLYYGFTKRDDAPDKREARDRLIALIEASPGVVDRGMVGYRQLIEEKARSAIHYYGCTYREIDCISARESAVVGCVPVVTDFAVFQEKDYCVKVPGEPADPATQQALAWKVVELLKNPDRLQQERERCRAIAARDTWESSAAAWAEAIEAGS